MKQQKKNWPAESNMTALKTLSHTLLHLDIQPTKMSPLVVKHPFTDSGLAGIYAEDGSLSVGNLLDSPDALRTWRENFSRRINEAETAMNLFCMITKPYQFGYLRLAAAHLSEQDMASFLSYAWISTESPNNDPNLSQRELLSMFRSLDPQKLMDQEEYTQFQNLDDVVTVYRWGADGQPEIDPEQAAIVRRIFSRFLLGHSVRQITTDLMADGIKTATGKTVWHDSVVQKMLCNEKYIGDALLQKTYIADLFTREKRVNNGELPKYYVHDCHPAIIDRETFQKVQEEIARRSSLKKTSSKAKTQLGKYCGKYVLSELLVCGECGSPYRRVIWTQKGAKRVVWRCQNRLEHGRKICKQSPTLDEGDIHDAVISAMNELFRMQAAKDAVKAGIAAVLAGEEQTLSLPAVEHQIRNLQERQLELFQLIVSAGADCTDYDEELQQVYMAKTKLMAQKAELEKEHRGAAAFDSRLAELDMALEQASGALTDFDELTVRQLVSNIKVLDKDSLLICFKDGTEITQTIQRRRSA